MLPSIKIMAFGSVSVSIIILVLSLTAIAQERLDIRPDEDGALRAQLLDDGSALLENEFLRCVFEPGDQGGASSLFFKPAEKEMAVSLSWHEKHNKAFRESVGRPGSDYRWPSTEGSRYDLIHLSIQEAGAVARFTGYPEVITEAEDPDAPYGNVRIIKTYTLRRGEPRVDVELRVVNENDHQLAIPVWIAAGGLRIDNENVNIFAPSPEGTVVQLEPWVAGGSRYMSIPRASGPWSAAIANDATRTGLYVAGREDQVESIDNWLIKFHGFQLGMGVRLHEVPAGGEMVVPYSFVATQNLSRIDAASPTLALGISLDAAEGNPAPGQETNISLEMVAPGATGVEYRFTARRLDADQPFFEREDALELEAGVGASQSIRLTFPDNGLYLLICEARDADGDALRAEIPVRVGTTDERYAARIPERVGQRHWETVLGEQPLPEWMLTSDREVRHPMVPWNTPAAEPFKVLFVGERDWTTGIVRDLAKRAGAEWELINLQLPQGSTIYRFSEQEMIARRLTEFKPDVVLTAGTRFNNVDTDFIKHLLNAVGNGMGLIIVGDAPNLAGPWLNILEGDDFTEIDAPNLGGMPEIAAEGIIRGPRSGPGSAFSYGDGRIIMMRRPAPGFRNQLLPRSMGRTELPDWEYYFMEYIRAMRFAAGREAAARIEGANIENDSITIQLASDAAREVTIVCDMASTDLLDMRHIVLPAALEEGAGEVKLPISAPVSSEYILHLWILDRPAGEGRTIAGIPGETAFLWRKTAGDDDAKVLDFDARLAPFRPAIAIEDFSIQDAREPVPSVVSLLINGVRADPNAELIARLRIFNGDDKRLVWRGESRFEPGERALFQGFDYAPVGPESWAIAEIYEGDRMIAGSRRSFRARTLNNFAEDDMAFFSVAGHIDDWYVTRMMRDWTIDAEVTLVPFSYGGRNIHWERRDNNIMDPPIVDDTIIRDDYSRSLPQSLNSGNVWMCLDDELQIGGEYDFSEPTIAAFRERLRETYGQIGNLNREWGTAYGAFGEVTPLLLPEARENPDRPGGWLDFRLFIDEKMNRRYEIAAEEAANVSPLMRTGPSGMYAPSYTTGVNYYLMCKPSRLIVTYAGVRADWAQAFMPEDGRIGIWRGYGGQRPSLVWEYAIRGFDALGWWGYITSGMNAHMSMIDISIKPAHNFDEVAEQQRELKRGLGKLLAGSRRADPRVFIPYSQSSAYVANVIDRNYADSTTAVRDMLESINILFTYVADEQAATGHLDDADSSVFILPGIVALPDEAASAYAGAINRGSFALADADVAVRNGHGTRLTAGLLDVIFGIDRSQSRNARVLTIEPINWTADAPEALRATPGEMPRALDGVAINADAGAKAWAFFTDGTPAVVAMRSQAGSMAIWLNTRFEFSPRTNIVRAVRPEDEPDRLAPLGTVENITRHLLSEAGIEPPIVVTPRDHRPSLVGHLIHGNIHYFGAQIHGLGEPRQVSVRLAGEGYIYDARAGRYIGEDSEFQATFDPEALAVIYSRLPYRVTGIEAAPDRDAVDPGEAVEISGRIVAEGVDAGEYHVVHSEVILPDGSNPRYYRSNLPAEAGRFSVTIPTALNGPAGQWRVVLRDAATGTTETVTFEVR